MIYTRRALLDCVLAARDRLLVTCTGMDIRTNKSLPLVTPLSELVDFAVRHGVRPAAGEAGTGVEIRHPRHAIGRRNFETGAVQPGRRWSHDQAALEASRGLGLDAPAQVTRVGALADMPIVELALLEEMIRDPLSLYLRKSLGVSTWRDADEHPAATFPLTLSEWDAEALGRDLLDRLLVDVGNDEAACIAGWTAVARMTGQVPFGAFGDAALAAARQLATSFRREAAGRNPPLPLHGFESLTVTIPLPNRILTGSIPIFHPGTNQLIDVRMSEGDRNARGMPIHVAALRLLVAQAGAGGARPAPGRSVVVSRHEDWVADGEHAAMIPRAITLDRSLASPDAARARLADICDLLILAMASPCGRFGKAAATTVRSRDQGRKEFGRFIGRPHFPRTREAAVYGLGPDFDDVFAPDSPEIRFHTAFERLFPMSRTYVMS